MTIVRETKKRYRDYLKKKMDSSGESLFQSLYGSLSHDLTEECAVAAISRRALVDVAMGVLESREDDANKSGTERRFEASEAIMKKGILIVQQNRADLLGKIWSYYDEGQKGYLLPDDMEILVSTYIRVLRAEAPKRVVDEAIAGAKLGIDIARRKNDYIALVDEDILEDVKQQIEYYMKLLRRDVERAVEDAFDKLLRPIVLKSVAKDVFEKCDEMTNDGWVTELEFKNKFLVAIHAAIEWNRILSTSKQSIAAAVDSK